MGLFNAKLPNSRIFAAPFIYQNLSPPYFRLQTKIQKSGSRLLLCLLKGFQTGMSQPHSTKTHKEDRIPWNGLLPDHGPGGGPLGTGHQPNNTTFVVYWLWKFGQDLILQSKVIQFMPTDRHTFCIPIVGEDIILHMKIYTFSLHYIHFFALLTHSLHLWRINYLKNTLRLKSFKVWHFFLYAKYWAFYLHIVTF